MGLSERKRGTNQTRWIERKGYNERTGILSTEQDRERKRNYTYSETYVQVAAFVYVQKITREITAIKIANRK